MKSKDRAGVFKALALLSQVGITMIVCVFAGVWIGNWLESKFDLGGIALIACIIIGVIAGFMNMMKLLTRGIGKK